MAENEDKTEQATPRRREKARQEGQIARSREFATMATTGGILVVMYMTGASFMRHMQDLTGGLLGLRYGRDAMTVMRAASWEMMLILAPLFAAAVLFALLTNLMQGGFLIKPLEVKVEKLNPLTGMKNIFSVNALPGMVKNIFKFILGIALVYLIARKIIVLVPETAAMELPSIMSVMTGLTGKAIAYIFTTFFILSVADYIYERWKFERSLRMSKEEIRQEFRESEGDPLIKAKIKSTQREMARRRMMEAVPRATVVITNPTHIAVALEYNKDTTAAPKVVAKGKGYVAQTIRELARKHGVPIMEDKPLARALYKVKLDSFIPSELFRAVAKILAYIYKMRGRAA